MARNTKTTPYVLISERYRICRTSASVV